MMIKLPIEYVQSNNRNYLVFKNDGGLSDFIRRGDIFEKHVSDLYKQIICEGKNIIDIGANIGVHTLEFAEIVGSGGNVYAFEPQRIVYYQLCGNIIANGFDNVYAYNIALSNKIGTTHIEKVDYYKNEIINIGNTHISNVGNEIEERTLDSYNFRNVKIIKMDVQGYEPFILEGALKTIEENNPYIFIEIEEEHLVMFNKKSKDVHDILNNNGYDLRFIHWFDFLAVPKFDLRFEDRIYIKPNVDISLTKIIFREYNSKIILYRQFNVDFKIGQEWWFNGTRLLNNNKLIVEAYIGDNIVFKRNLNK